MLSGCEGSGRSRAASAAHTHPFDGPTPPSLFMGHRSMPGAQSIVADVRPPEASIGTTFVTGTFSLCLPISVMK